MPLIWDDNEYLIVDVEDDYDRSRYVISRKLFITPNGDNVKNSPFTVQFIDRNMRRFGTIESIEILPNGKCEAYVTFANDQGAGFALFHNEVEKKQKLKETIFNIQPANTWKQPPDERGNDEDYPMQDDEFTPPFLTLNEHCILKITKYMDLDSMVNFSEVCKLFHRLLHQHCFPRIQEYAVENRVPSTAIPLAKLRRTLKCVGSFITQLTFLWYDRDHENRLQRYLDQLGKYVGENIRWAYFRNVFLHEHHIPPIRNILLHLDTLDLEIDTYDFGEYVFDFDLTALCPSLKKLKLVGNWQMSRACKPWPTLKHISIFCFDDMVTSTFQSFLEQNSQIQCLKFRPDNDTDVCLAAVSRHSPNIQKLTIHSSYPSLAPSNIVHLRSLQHLTILHLMTLADSEINGILQCLTRFTGLRVLKLHLSSYDFDFITQYEPNQQAMISLAQNLPNLKKFYTKYIKWSESTLIDFIQFASQLKVLHVHSSHLTFTNSLVRKIVEVLQKNRLQHDPTRLELFVDDATAFEAINDPAAKRLLNLSTECIHSSY